MAASILIQCPECQRQSKAPPSIFGKKVRCKYCQAAFVARKAPDKPPAGKSTKPAKPSKSTKPAKPEIHDEEDGDANPYGVTTLDMAPRCPNCANEMEDEEAVICLHCGYNTVTRQLARLRKIYGLTFFEHFVWLLPGIACLLVALAVIGFNVWYQLNIKDMVDETQDSWYVYMWGSGGIRFWVLIVSLFIIWFSGKFAVKRLILHPKPPEVEKLK